MNPMQKLILLFVAALVCGVMTACGPDLLELDPQEPSDLTVAQLVAKMNHATDPKGNYSSRLPTRCGQRLTGTEKRSPP